MTPMLLTIALHELRASVLRPSFVLMTLGMPLLMGLYLLTVTGIVSLSAVEANRTGTARPWSFAVVDIGDLLDDTDGLRELDSRRAAIEALDDGTISAFVVLPADYVQRGEIELYAETFDVWAMGQPPRIASRVNQELLRTAGVDSELLARTRRRPAVSRYERGEADSFVKVDAALKLAALGIPAATTFGLILALAMNASLLLASVVEDKENKMMDVLLSSAPADDLLFGKVIGIVGAGLLQLTVWALITLPLVAFTVLATVDDPSALLSVISVPRLLLGIGFGVVSFLFYGVMLVGLGSFGSSFRDSQQLAAVVIMMPMVPLIAAPLFLSNANGMVPRILSFLPPTAAPAMMLRMAVDEVAAWEIALSLAVLLASIWLAVRVAAKLFRVGTLLYGKRPSLSLLIRSLVEPM